MGIKDDDEEKKDLRQEKDLEEEWGIFKSLCMHVPKSQWVYKSRGRGRKDKIINTRKGRRGFWIQGGWEEKENFFYSCFGFCIQKTTYKTLVMMMMIIIIMMILMATWPCQESHICSRIFGLRAHFIPASWCSCCCLRLIYRDSSHFFFHQQQHTDHTRALVFFFYNILACFFWEMKNKNKN